jgi:hypothetical protein
MYQASPKISSGRGDIFGVLAGMVRLPTLTVDELPEAA